MENHMRTAEKFWMVMKTDQKGGYCFSRQEAINKAKERAEDCETVGTTFYVLEVVNAFSRGEAPINELRVEEPVLDEAPADDV